MAAGPVYYVENQAMNDDQEVMNRLAGMYQQNHELKVSISAEMTALHGDVIKVLDHVRSLGIKKVGYQIRAARLGGAAPAGGGAAPPPPPPPPH